MSTKVHLVKATVFPVVMYGCESWTIKKAERWRIDVFELWCWRRLLRVLWTARRSNQSILKEISPGYSLEGLILKLKLQYFGHLMRRADSFENTLMLGKIEGRRRRGWQRIRRLDGIIDSKDMSLDKLRIGDGEGALECCGSWGRKESGTTERLNWLNTLFTKQIYNIMLYDNHLICYCCLAAKYILFFLQPMDFNLSGCPWDFPGKNTGVGCHFFLQGIYSSHRLNLCFLLGRKILLLLSH